MKAVFYLVTLFLFITLFIWANIVATVDDSFQAERTKAEHEETTLEYAATNENDSGEE